MPNNSSKCGRPNLIVINLFIPCGQGNDESRSLRPLYSYIQKLDFISLISHFNTEITKEFNTIQFIHRYGTDGASAIFALSDPSVR